MVTDEYALSPSDQQAFDRAEAVIKKGLNTFFEVGLALTSIRDNKWYRAKGYSTFVDYCQIEWGIGRSQAYRIIGSHGVLTTLRSQLTGDLPLPKLERQIRPLLCLTPSEQVDAWIKTLKISESTGRDITARDVEQSVIELKSGLANAPVKVLVDQEFNAAETRIEDSPIPRTEPTRSNTTRLYDALSHLVWRISEDNKALRPLLGDEAVDRLRTHLESVIQEAEAALANARCGR